MSIADPRPVQAALESAGRRGHVLRVSGDFDAAGAAVVTRLLDGYAPGPGTRLVADLSGSTYLDSAALAVLIHTARRLRHAGGDLVLVAVAAQPVRKIDLTGTRSLFNLCHTVEEALGLALHDPGVPAGGVMRLRLFVDSESRHAEVARHAVDQLLGELGLPEGDIDVDVVDVRAAPDVAEAERVLATPMLVRLAPSPVRRVVGDLRDLTAVTRALALDAAAATTRR